MNCEHFCDCGCVCDCGRDADFEWCDRCSCCQDEDEFCRWCLCYPCQCEDEDDE